MNSFEHPKPGSNWKDILHSASQHMETGQYASSMVLFSQAVELIETQHGEDDIKLCLPLVKLGKLHQLRGRTVTAERFYRRSADILTKMLIESDGEAIDLKPYLTHYES